MRVQLDVKFDFDKSRSRKKLRDIKNLADFMNQYP